MNTTFQQLYRHAHLAFDEIIGDMRPALQSLKGATKEDLADASFALKKSEELLEAARKKLTAARLQLDAVACKTWMKENDPEPIRTEYTTASPDVKIVMGIPSKGTPEYAAMCREFGVSEEAIEQQLFKPSYSSMADYTTRLAAEGIEPPPWLGKQRDEFVLRHLKRKEVDQD